MADDLEQFLSVQPIKASPPNLRQRVAKWSRRNQALVAGATAVMALLLVAAANAQQVSFHYTICTGPYRIRQGVRLTKYEGYFHAKVREMDVLFSDVDVYCGDGVHDLGMRLWQHETKEKEN